jgi:hypothetical protein
MYYSENYHRIAKKYPGNPFREMMKYVSKEWKQLSKEEQEVPQWILIVSRTLRNSRRANSSTKAGNQAKHLPNKH